MALHRVGMAEIKIGMKGDRLQALGLGSCIGVLMLDKKQNIGGMAHVMLPDSSIGRSGSTQVGKFADTGVPELLRLVVKAGARKTGLEVKIAGGAEMFAFAGGDSPRLAVGHRNGVAVREELSKLGLKIKAEDIGGNAGRTFEVDLDTFVSTIKVVGKEPTPF